MSVTIFPNELLVFSAIITSVSALFWRFPPKQINQSYGYRSGRSMKSEEAWEAANQYASRKLLAITTISSVLTLFFYAYYEDAMKDYGAVYGLAFISMSVFLVVPMTESYLKRHFSDDE